MVHSNGSSSSSSSVAQVAVDRRSLRRAIGLVLSEYQEYGADPDERAVACEAISALYGPFPSYEDLKRELDGQYRDAYAEAIKIATPLVDDFY